MAIRAHTAGCIDFSITTNKNPLSINRETLILSEMDRQGFELFVSLSGISFNKKPKELLKLLRPWDPLIRDIVEPENMSEDALLEFYNSVVGDFNPEDPQVGEDKNDGTSSVS